MSTSTAPSRVHPNGLNTKRYQVRAPRCHQKGCPSRAACFGFPGEEAVSCGTHRWNGMVNLDTYTGPGSVLKRPARAANKRPRRVSGGYSKSCTAEGCTENATFGYEQSAGLRRRECCGRHKLPGMVDLATAAESAGAAEASKRQSSSVEKRQTRARSGGGGSVNGWSIGSSDESTEGDGHSEEEGDNDSDYEEKGWEEEAGEDEEEAAGPQRRSGERCKTSGCDKAATFGFPGGPCVSCPEHHRGGMLNLHFCYQNLPKRRYPSKRKRAEQEQEEEEEEEVDVGVEQSTEYSHPEAAARDGQPHMRNKKKPRGTVVDGAAVTAGPGGGDGDGGSGGSGAAAAVRAGVAGDSSEADIASVGGGAGSPNHQGVGWLVGGGGGGGHWGGGGGADGADDERPVPMGVSDEACFEVVEDAAELWCHQDASPVEAPPTRAPQARPQVAMVAVKHELGGGAAAVKQEVPEATLGGQQLTAADQGVLGPSHAGEGNNVAGAVDVKPELTEKKAWLAKDWSLQARGWEGF